MTGRYQQIMGEIEVTREMRARMLQAIDAADLSRSAKVTPIFRDRRYLSAAACFAVLLAGAFALPAALNQVLPPDPPAVVSPEIVTCDSLAELERAVGFEVEQAVPPFTVESLTYSARGDFAQITYSGQGQTAVFRKSAGSGDNSGDYNQYGAVDTLYAGPLAVTLKGNGDAYRLAIWTKGDYAYSMNLSQGVSTQQWAQLLAPLG